jgi:hypothetical protein
MRTNVALLQWPVRPHIFYFWIAVLFLGVVCGACKTTWFTVSRNNDGIILALIVPLRFWYFPKVGWALLTHYKCSRKKACFGGFVHFLFKKQLTHSWASQWKQGKARIKFNIPKNATLFGELIFMIIFYSRPKHSILRSYIKWRFFIFAALLIKAKQQHGKNQNKNTGLFINCMDFVVVRTKITKNKIVIFFSYA